MVLRRRHQAIDSLDDGRAIVRIDPTGTAINGQQRRWLVGAVAQDPARPMILERARDVMDTVRKQQRRQSIAGKATQRTAVEANHKRPRAIDAAAARQAKRRHRSASPELTGAAVAAREVGGAPTG